MSVQHSQMERSGACACINTVRQCASSWWVGATAFAATNAKGLNDQRRP